MVPESPSAPGAGKDGEKKDDKDGPKDDQKKDKDAAKKDDKKASKADKKADKKDDKKKEEKKDDKKKDDKKKEEKKDDKKKWAVAHVTQVQWFQLSSRQRPFIDIEWAQTIQVIISLSMMLYLSW